MESGDEPDDALDLELVEELHEALGVDLELLLCLLESTGGRVTKDLLKQVDDLNDEANINIIEVHRGMSRLQETQQGAVVVFVSDDPFLRLEVQPPLTCGAEPWTSVYTARCAFKASKFGVYKVKAIFVRQEHPKEGDGLPQTTYAEADTIAASGNALGRGKEKGKVKSGNKRKGKRNIQNQTFLASDACLEVLSTSPPYRLARALSGALDSFIWGDALQSDSSGSAGGGDATGTRGMTWSEDLEAALLNMVVAVEDDLRLTMGSSSHLFGRMMQAVGEESMDPMVDSLKTLLARALDKRDAVSLGMVHANVLQFVDMAAMGMGALVPKPLTDSASSIVRATFQASSKVPMVLELQKVGNCASDYMQHLLVHYGPQDTELSSMRRLKNATDRFTISAKAPAAGSPEDNEILWEAIQTVCAMGRSGRMLLGMGRVGEVSGPRLSWSFALPLQKQDPQVDGGWVDWKSLLDPFSGPVDELQETLIGSISLGSMMGYRLPKVVQGDGQEGKVVGKEVVEAGLLIDKLLYAGLGYLSTREEGRLIPLLDINRAALFLRPGNNGVGSQEDEEAGVVTGSPGSLRRLRAKRKEVARLLRARDRGAVSGVKGKDKVLSLRINTNIRMAITKLQEHHKDSWVSQSLQEVWCSMARGAGLNTSEQGHQDSVSAALDPGAETRQGRDADSISAGEFLDGDGAQPRSGSRLGSFFCFELWLGEEMIAADFGNAVGGSFYVATRFYEESHKKFQPGFILALVETEFLRSAGFSIWDLGGTDRSPMMAYKTTLAETVERPVFIARFRSCKGESGVGAGLRGGTVAIPDIKEEHLLRV